MICPYCSTDMEPIELNGKVFCSNCGLTIANNGPTPSSNTISPDPDKISEVTTDAAEEVEFPIIPEIAASSSAVIPSVAEESLSNTPEGSRGLGQDDNEERVTTPRKLEVETEESIATPESWSPVTTAAAADLGIEAALTVPEAPVPEVVAETPTELPTFESKIADLSIPSEDDFSAAAPTETTPGSYVELANPGNERSTLETSGILLDILGEGSKQEPVPISSNESENSKTASSRDARTIDPVTEPEIPKETETKEQDDIYTLPSEIKVGLRNKKVKKEDKNISVIPSVAEESLSNIPEGSRELGRDDNETIDPKTEKKIEKLETKIAEAPVPVVDLSPEEAEKYDPDTIDLHEINMGDAKSKVIKDYFSTAIEKDKTAHKTKAKQKKQKKSWKALGIFVAVLIGFAILGFAGYYAYTYYKPANRAAKAQETAKFTTLSPTYIPEGYILATSTYSDSAKTYETKYAFTNDALATITYKQVKTEDGKKFISDYLLSVNATFIEKEINGIVFTEANKTNLLWSKNGFVYVIEANNFTLSNDLLYKMAESVK